MVIGRGCGSKSPGLLILGEKVRGRCFENIVRWDLDITYLFK